MCCPSAATIQAWPHANDATGMCSRKYLTPPLQSPPNVVKVPPHRGGDSQGGNLCTVRYF